MIIIIVIDNINNIIFKFADYVNDLWKHLFRHLFIFQFISVFIYIKTYLFLHWNQFLILFRFTFFSFIYLFFFSKYAAGDCPDNYYWNGTQCSACSGCPVGFGLREPCSKIKNTECQECYPGYDYSNSTGMEECIK